MRHQVSKNIIFCPYTHPSTDPGDGLKRSIFFSECGHVVYQLKGNHECSNMVANILAAEPLPDPGMGSMGQNSIFTEYGHVAY